MENAVLDRPLPQGPSTVRKRDGSTIQAFDIAKIENAVRKAWQEAHQGDVDEAGLRRVALLVSASLPITADVEQIQDAVEVALMHQGRYEVAKAFILYRQRRAEAREVRQAPDSRGIQNYIHFSKYAKYSTELRRREVYEETVGRVEDMHLRRFAHLPDLLPQISRAFDLVRQKRLLPSMRSMQFGGKAVEASNARLYNCSFTHIDRLRAFAEGLYLLLCGCGVGYSVQFDHVEKLPRLGFIDEKVVVHHVIADTIEGWADALFALLNSYVRGYHVEFSYHLIRDAGVPLKTSGGRAPGHMKLKASLEEIREVLHGAQGRKLRPIECHRIMCHAADAVLSGGIRRSAMIALFSFEDSEMMYAKTGNWRDTEPYFENANNSVALKRDEVKEKQFKRIFEMTKEFGEPGFVFLDNLDYGTNPCAEIGMNPRLRVDNETMPLIQKRGLSAVMGQVITGWSFCNLTEMNAALMQSLDDFMEAARAATLIGTLQASYTSFPYLGFVSEVIAERDALLGVGMTGMLDSPAIACNPDYQRQVAEAVKKWNAEYAEMIGIRPAARLTCVKPSGTTSLELGCVGSGHHAHHARRYIRRVVADEYEVVFQNFKKSNPHMCVRKPNGKWVVEFAVQAPEGAIVKKDIGAIEFLEMVRSTQQNWVLPGTARTESSPGLNHNVSNTVHVKDSEWDVVADYLWQHKDSFTGVSFIPDMGDTIYAFAPFEAIVTEAQERRWNEIVNQYVDIDYTQTFEDEDGTSLSGEVACAGGACAV